MHSFAKQWAYVCAGEQWCSAMGTRPTTWYEINIDFLILSFEDQAKGDASTNILNCRYIYPMQVAIDSY